MKYWVYVHINRINGKKYVGTTHQNDPKTRWLNGKGYKSNKHFNTAIEKYNWKNFDHCYMECRSEEEMYRLEQYYIEKYQTNNPEFGYNKSIGGEKSSWKGKDSQSKEYHLDHYHQNKTHMRLQQKGYWKEYSLQNKEKIKEYQKEYRLQHKEHHKEYMKSYNQRKKQQQL